VITLVHKKEEDVCGGRRDIVVGKLSQEK